MFKPFCYLSKFPSFLGRGGWKGGMSTELINWRVWLNYFSRLLTGNLERSLRNRYWLKFDTCRSQNEIIWVKEEVRAVPRIFCLRGVFVRFRTNIATRNSPAKSDTMLEKKHLVFLAGATAPFAPPLCTALEVWTEAKWLLYIWQLLLSIIHCTLRFVWPERT